MIAAVTSAKSFITSFTNDAIRLDDARTSQGSRSASDLLRTMPWKAAMISCASTSNGTSFSMAATVTTSDRDNPLRSLVRRRATVRAKMVHSNALPSAFSARRRRVAHSVITQREPRNPCALRRRHSSAPLWHPAAHRTSCQGRQISSEFSRVRKMHERWPRKTLRTRPRLYRVRRTISLIGIPSLASPRMIALASSRCSYPSYWMRSPAVSSLGSTVAAPTAQRI
jgi:hypothetical protein